MTQLKDVIHLYLGCKAEYKNVMNNVTRFTLRGIHYNHHSVLFAYDRDKSFPVDGCKLYLRKLSSMTDEELIGLAKMHDPKIEWEVVDGNCIGRKNSGIQEKIILDDGLLLIEEIENNIFGQEGEGSTYRSPLSNADIFRYLLSKRFDLFGLIESSQAIEEPLK